MSDMWHVRLTVNGQPAEVDVPAGTTLVQLLREHLGLTGTKVGCDEGECGACTIIMNGDAVASCLIPAARGDGADIWTIEGIGSDEHLHPLQEAFLREGAVQCGYCTPGMIMSGIALLRKNPHPTRDEIVHAISGNICRCTGYRQIIRAIESCVEELDRTGQSA